MRNPFYSSQFRRDVKKAQQRGYDMQKLKDAVDILLAEKPLPPQFHDHALKGKWKHHRELHLEPDWLLLYKILGDGCIFARTGTHADLFSL